MTRKFASMDIIGVSIAVGLCLTHSILVDKNGRHQKE